MIQVNLSDLIDFLEIVVFFSHAFFATIGYRSQGVVVKIFSLCEQFQEIYAPMNRMILAELCQFMKD